MENLCDICSRLQFHQLQSPRTLFPFQGMEQLFSASRPTILAFGCSRPRLQSRSCVGLLLLLTCFQASRLLFLMMCRRRDRARESLSHESFLKSWSELCVCSKLEYDSNLETLYV